ncbi:RNA methyltransferase [Candidatus Dependentiae bacterium]|nr:RNA methyltransferase [Candidatus Dependentiae bacterium]
MKQIVSRHNPEIKAVCDLHHHKGRKQKQQFIAEGLRIIQTFLEYHHPLVRLYACPEQVPLAKTLIQEDYITQVTEDVMSKMSTTTSPSGLLAVFSIPPSPAWDQLTPGMVLAQIADPGNMGTLIRTAAAMNFKTVVVVDGCDPWSPKVIQASAGTMAGVRIFNCSWQELIQHKKPNLPLYALVVTGGKSPQDIAGKQALLVVGNEAQGMPSAWIAQCDGRITIPMPGKTESLNAAVAGSIALYLMSIQRINSY